MKKIKVAVIFAFILSGLMFKLFIKPPIAESQTGTIPAPTGVIATDDAYSTKVGLYWDTMRGATAYRIFRNTANDPATAIDVGTTAANYFFDANAAQSQTYFYWIRSENGSLQSGFSQPEQGRRAAGVLGNGTQPLQPPTAPPGNPVTATKAALGKTLFWDEQLSSTRTVSCGTCHAGAAGGVDKRTATQRARSTNPGFDQIFNSPDDVFGSPGVTANNADGSYSWNNVYGFREQVTGRRAMPYTDAAYPLSLFWDGRAAGTFRDPLTNQIVLQNGAALESQILGPPVNDTEMAHAGRNWQEVANRIAGVKPLALATNVPVGLRNWLGGRTYSELFEEAFGTPEVTPVRIAMAIATHERTLFSDQTPFDQVNQGIGTLTAAEQRGRNLFNSGVTDCSDCHSGNLLSDNGFHYIGVRPTADDTGRQQVTGNANNVGQFRTPNLRNVELRGAYFHNGRFTTLREVVDFYARGGDFNAPNKDPNIRTINLSDAQRSDLVAFLSRPLTDPRVSNELPPFDRPTLYTETNRVPQISGTGRTGAGNLLPQVHAIEPPLAGNPSFTVGVSNALGGAQAVLVIDANDPGAGTTIPSVGVFARRTISLSGNGNGNGYGSISLAIPDNLAGRTFFGRWYIADASAQNGFSVSQVFSFTVFGEGNSNDSAFVDFDGDGKTDVSVFRSGDWYRLNSSNNQFVGIQFGMSGDRLTPADFDGDGKTDVAVFRNGTWYSLNSTTGFRATVFGAPDDIPLPGDYDGDRKADINVFRPSNGTWYRLNSANNQIISVPFGAAGDVPISGDFDGDGKFDLAVFRAGVWHSLNSSNGGTKTTDFGLATDKPVAADYDGDNKTDLAVFRNGVWHVLRSVDSNLQTTQFGISTDIPVAGDYDGDGRSDIAVFRDGFWYQLRSQQGFGAIHFGVASDAPVPAAFVP